MNASTGLLGIALLVAAAGGPAAASSPPGIAINCATMRLPSLQQVGQFTGMQNFARVYDLRERLMMVVSRDCQLLRVGSARAIVLHPQTLGIVEGNGTAIVSR